MVVGPTKVQPRFLRSFDSAFDTSVVGFALRWARSTTFGRWPEAGSNPQK